MHVCWLEVWHILFVDPKVVCVYVYEECGSLVCVCVCDCKVL